MTLYIESIFIAFEKVQFIVYVAVVENTLKVFAGLWLLHAGFGVRSLIASFLALRFVALGLDLMLFHWQISPLAWQYDRRLLGDLLRNVPVFGGILVVATLYARADVFMLSKMASLAAVGFYTAAYRLFAISQVIPKSFNTSIYPVLSNLFIQSPESYRRVKALSIRYILVGLLPIAAGIHGLAEPIMQLLFGREFVVAAPVLKVVIWTLVPYGVTKVLASSLFASDRQVVDLKVNLMGVAVNVTLNLVLIPRFGSLGCAWATLISIVFFLACQCVYLRGEMLSVLRQAEMARPALAAVTMLLWLLWTPGVLLPLRVMGGAVIYLTLLFVLQVVSIRDLRLFLPERVASVLVTRERSM